MTKLAIIALCLALAACAIDRTACTGINLAAGTADCVNTSYAGTGAHIGTLSAVYPVAGPSIKAPSGKSIAAGKLAQ